MSCMYCGSNALGYGCGFSPTGKHVEEPGDPNSCRFCHSSAYGYGCGFNEGDSEEYGIFSLPHTHVHGSDGIHCIYCGAILNPRYNNVGGMAGGYGCPFSPDGKHRY